jgi:hypothetical protein
MWVAQISGEPTHVLDAVGALGPESFWSLTRTLDELSLVSGLQSHPSFAKIEGPWVLFQVEGVLDFGLTGILNSLTKPMADAGISIFAISTYNTDYILVKSDVAAIAEQVWVNSGFPVILL